MCSPVVWAVRGTRQSHHGLSRACLWTPWMAFRNGKVSRGDRVSCARLLLLPDETQLSFQWKAGVIFIPHQALKTIHIYHFFYLLSTVTVKKKWGYQAEASGRVLFLKHSIIWLFIISETFLWTYNSDIKWFVWFLSRSLICIDP